MAVDSSVGCVAAYNSISIDPDGSIEPCCQYTRDLRVSPVRFTEFDKYQNTIQRNIHQDSEAGVKHPGCQKCWSEEDRSWKSLRNYLSEWYHEDVSLTVNSENPIYDIELRLGNFCNLKCIMCFPNASSSIAAERLQYADKFASVGMHASYTELPHYWETQEFWDFSEKLFKDARRVNITGGEPFIIPEVTKIIDRLMPKKDTVKLSFNTNLTKLSNKLIDQLKEFKNLMINVSLEGVEEMNDYLRYPSKWPELLGNFNKVKSELPNAWVTVNHTFQHSSIYALPRLAEFCFRNNVTLALTSVQGDDRLKINSVPPKDIDKFRTWIVNSSVLRGETQHQLLQSLDKYTFKPNDYTNYIKYVNVLDEIRGTDFYSVFKEATKYVDNPS